ncbi:tetratricopeptide repeat protein [Nocardia sp. NPDC127579]|uniref:tetratricopeptide repeat protein n=1 Tax=Nocardia sp. NPDC127579 TaxID=3345402 RepID=UPI0036428038
MVVVGRGTGGEQLGPARRVFVQLLGELFEAAGRPKLDQVVRHVNTRFSGTRGLPSMQRISAWRSGENVPKKWESLEPLLLTLFALAQPRKDSVPAGLLSKVAWQRIWRAATAEPGPGIGTAKHGVMRQEGLPLRPALTDTLPRDLNTLIGRDEVLSKLVDAAGPGRAMSILSIDGMPGIGKTALAIRAAHVLADEFPDGRFFVNLHAHTVGHASARPAEVLAGLLTDLGIDPHSIPEQLENRRNIWRDRLSGKRVLLVLDDAADLAQVEPLLPKGPGCLTIITSRRRLVDLDGAQPFPLDTLDPDRAAELFCTLAHRTPAGGEVDAVHEITRLCGYLPLALVLLASRLAHHPSWTIAALAADLGRAQDPLGELAAGERAVYAAFTMSYRDLPPERQRLFRRASLHPGPDLDHEAAAVLDGISVAVARRELDALFTDHLLDEPAGGRYRMHDLLRQFGRALAEQDPETDRRAVLDRLLDHYRELGGSADRCLAGEPQPDYFPGRPQALAWLRAERGNLLACLEHAAAHQQSDRVLGLTSALSGLLRLDGPWPQAIALHRRAAVTAQQAGDRRGAADALNDLGMVRYATGDYPGTADLVRQALAIYQEIGDRDGQARALSSLGRLGYATGEYEATADLVRQALAIYREGGDRVGEAFALIGLAVVRYAVGDYPGTADLVRQALAIFQREGDRFGAAYALNQLGMVEFAVGDYPAAAEVLGQALAIYQEIGDRLTAAHALSDLVAVRFSTADYPMAASLGAQALASYQEVGDRLGEAYALSALGRLRHAIGDLSGAADYMERALALFQHIGDRVGTAYTLGDLSFVQLSTGNYGVAVGRMRDGLTIFEEIGDRAGQGYTLLMLGLGRYVSGEYPQVTELTERALALFREVGDRVGQAYALCSLGRLGYAVDDLRTAVEQVRQAVSIFEEIGDRVGEAYALSCLSRLCFAQDDSAAAERLVRQAGRMYEEVGDRFGHAVALGGLAMLRFQCDDYAAATELAERALAIFVEIGDRVGQAYAYICLGVVRFRSGDQAGAAELVEKAPVIFQEIGDRLGEAYAFMGLGLIRYRSGDHSGVADLLRQMLAVFREIGERPGQAEMLDRIAELWDLAEPQNAVLSYIDAARLGREIQVRWRKRRVWRDLPVPDNPR